MNNYSDNQMMADIERIIISEEELHEMVARVGGPDQPGLQWEKPVDGQCAEGFCHVHGRPDAGAHHSGAD